MAHTAGCCILLDCSSSGCIQQAGQCFAALHCRHSYEYVLEQATLAAEAAKTAELPIVDR